VRNLFEVDEPQSNKSVNLGVLQLTQLPHCVVPRMHFIASAAALSYVPTLAAFIASIAAFDFLRAPSGERLSAFVFFDTGVGPAGRFKAPRGACW
jgi:hypothetical protein